MHGTHKIPDPLAGIEDMLSSLCGAQNHPRDHDDQDIEHGIQGAPDLNMLDGKTFEDDMMNEDSVPTTPEKSASPRGRLQRRGRAAHQRKRSNASKRLPPSNRIRKSQKDKSQRRTGQREEFKQGVSHGFENEVAPQEHDVLGSSSDDRENMNFLHQMKRLAEEQLDVHKRKNDAMNVKAINGMKRRTDQCVQKMKQVAGKVSRDIINRATEIEEALPRNLSEHTASAMKAVESEKDGFADFMSQAKAFEDQVNKLVRQVQVQRKGNKEKHDTEEREMYANAKAVCASGQHLISVLQKVDDMIDVDQFKGT